MDEITNAEREILGYIRDRKLRTSLSLIRQATEIMWADDSPQIVRGFTEHGVRHSERIAESAAKLLAVNYGKDISNQEAYLLLAGIYLHDVGMQCDVIKYPKILASAKKYGAQFETELTSHRVSELNIGEQKAIRQNHHYLTAAWIDYFDRNGEGEIKSAIQSIPKDWIDDLIDICIYHAKLPIDNCPENFNLNPTGRKRLVAALLRLSDELDIDRRRVTIEVIQNFSLDPENSVYWWLHHRTNVFFVADNTIRIQIWLSPDDIEQYGQIVHNLFVDKFRHKNRSVLDVLVENKFPATISSDSGVVKLNRADPLPLEIIQVLHQMQKIGKAVTESESMDEFEEEEGFMDRAVKIAEAGEALNESMLEVNQRTSELTKAFEAADERLIRVQGDVRKANVIASQMANMANNYADSINEVSGKMRNDWNTFHESFRPFLLLESDDLRRFMHSAGESSSYVERVISGKAAAESLHESMGNLNGIVGSTRVQLSGLRGISKSLNKSMRRVDLALQHFGETINEIMNGLIDVVHLAERLPDIVQDM